MYIIFSMRRVKKLLLYLGVFDIFIKTVFDVTSQSLAIFSFPADTV